jgi:DTW domain-containing protein YfiP
MPSSAEPIPRTVCGQCRRPTSVCYCRHVTPIPTVTRIILLQHPRERDVAIGTARMANLCLPNSELHVGVHWQGSQALAQALSDPRRPAALLYPGTGAIDVVQKPPSGPITLVVVDGTWWQTKKVVRENPELAALPRYAFTPAQPSEYRIRREPHETYVSTIEALVHVLAALEPDGARFEQLLTPFRAMIDAQIACEKEMRGGRVRHARARAARGRASPVPAFFAERREDLVVVVGEANAWPYRSTERAEGHYPDELIHLVACRIATGETFDAIIAPRHPLSPNTCAHVRLSPDELARGCDLPSALRAWQSFVRDSDIICSWGRYATSLLVACGGQLPSPTVDLRLLAKLVARGTVGTLESYAELRGGVFPKLRARGRAGMRLALSEHVARSFSQLASDHLGRSVPPATSQAEAS